MAEDLELLCADRALPDLPPGLGSATDVEPLKSSPGSRVWRLRLDGERAVVKQIVGPHADARFAREITALRLAGPDLAPTVLAEDAEQQVVALEFVDGDGGMPPWDLYADALARLHARATTPGGGFTAQELLPVATTAGPADLEAFARMCAALEVDPAPAEPELTDLLQRLTDVPRTALLHGDPCQGNLLVNGDVVRFVDFEQAAHGDGVTELSYLRIGFPTCGLNPVVPASEVERAEAVYRSSWRAAGGSGEPGSVGDQCVGWLLRSDALVQRAERGQRDQFARVLDEDWFWGPLTGRLRLARRLDIVAALVAETMPATAALARALRPRLPDPLPT